MALTRARPSVRSVAPRRGGLHGPAHAAAGRRAGAPAVAWARRHRRTSASAPSAGWATPSCARRGATPNTWTTRCCWSTCCRSGTRWCRRARQVGNIDADTDQAFAWEPFLVRDRSVNAFAPAGRLHRGASGPDRHHHHARPAGLGAGARALACHAAPHRAQHRAAGACVAGVHCHAAAGHHRRVAHWAMPTSPMPRSWAGRARPSRRS